ncbi:MAG: RNA polymerase sigma-70 factor [Gemmatimonadaceae bacterium]|jgi:RNA polymerase sigma-70 factor (ECF subfamily)|nr:RNA polymerase sigma-70 factor [Gemmatimonadaceae bacterium]
MMADRAQPDEQQLFARVRDGDRDAFEQLFHLHYVPLCRFAASLVRDTGTAEDLVQDTMVALWMSRDRLPVADSPRAYLYRAVRNRALNAIRHDRVVQRFESHIDPTEPVTAAAGDDEMAGRDAVDAAARAIELLPPRCREIFLLSREHNLSYADIARALDISVKTVETQMGRALKKLRDAVAPHLG